MLISTSEFSKDSETARARMASEICSLWKFTSAYLNQIPREIMFLLTKNLHEKSITESQDRRNFDSACALFVICIRVTLSYSTSMKNAPVLSQSDANNFFIFIIILITQGRREVKCLIRAKEGNNVYGQALNYFAAQNFQKKNI